MLKVNKILFSVVFGVSSISSFAEIPNSIKVNNQPNTILNNSKTIIAIEPFFSPIISQVITNDLNQLGDIQAIESNQVTNSRYQVSNQTMLKDEILTINFVILDKETNQTLSGVQTVSTKNTPQSIRIASHRIADRIYELITGKLDYSGKIKYVVKA